MRLILASSSKTRRAILDMLGFKYEVITSKDAEKSNETDFEKYVIGLSKIKARSAAKQLNNEKALIIAADTIICMGNKKFEKPKSKEKALENMQLFSGNMNYALTGVTIRDLYKNKELTFFDKTEVYFKKITEADMHWYINNTEHILEHAGYSLADGKALIFLDKIVGDYYNILGMPISKLYTNFNELGYSASDF